MSIAIALFSDSQSRVLQWLFGQPERGFHLSELRRLTGVGSASLQRELNRLAEAGLVNAERVGNMRRFQANDQRPVYPELLALTRKTLGVEPVLREALEPLLPDLKTAWVYGSVAKQTDTSKSDIDVMLVGEKLTPAKVLKLLVPLEPQLGRKINPTLYTPAEFKRRRGGARFVREPRPRPAHSPADRRCPCLSSITVSASGSSRPSRALLMLPLFDRGPL